MKQTQQDFAAEQYGPRAADYVTSAVHASGPDLDRLEALLAGKTRPSCSIWVAAAGM